jgi:hypothetical protein
MSLFYETRKIGVVTMDQIIKQIFIKFPFYYEAIT